MRINPVLIQGRIVGNRKWHYFSFNAQGSGDVGQEYLPQVGIKSFNI